MSATAKRAHLTEAVIVDASMKLLAGGKKDFTLARLASELGVSAPSLYSHVPSKQYIVERVRSRVVSSIDYSSFARSTWDAALIDWARSYAAAFARYPETIPLLANNPVQAPELVDQYEAVARAFIDAGWPPENVMSAITAVESFVLGSVLDMVAPAQMVQPSAGQYPTVEALTRQTPPNAARASQAFEMGLHALVAGLRANVAQ